MTSPGDVQLAVLSRAIPRLHDWYRENARDLPWRRTRDPYTIWLSEVMLQQTRVSTVIPYFERWLERFPTVTALAAADIDDVLKLWEGLGYYRRARSFHAAAATVVSEHDGVVPREPGEFARLPGVGPYTTAAVMSIAFDHDLAVVDGNVRRVLARWVALDEDPRSGGGARLVDQLAQQLLPPGTAAVHNQAVMELGALVCSPRSPLCQDCPLRDECRAFATGRPERYPILPKRAPVPHVDVAVGIVLDGDRVLVDRRPYDAMLGGLWEFPGGKVEEAETPEQALHRELAEELALAVEIVASLPAVRHAYSHFRVTLYPFVCRATEALPVVAEGPETRWCTLDELGDLAMPKANHKVLGHLRAYLEDGQQGPLR